MSPRFGLNPALLALLGFVLLFNSWWRIPLPAHSLWTVVLSPQVYFLLASAVILKVLRISPREIGLHSRRGARDLALGLALGLAPAVLTLGLAGLLTWIDGVHPFLRQPLFGGLPLPAEWTAARLWTLFLTAPLFEEIFFRGVLLKSLTERYPVRWAVILSALLFMAAHGGRWGIASGPLLLGLIAAPVALKTGSLLPGIVFHAIANAYGPVLIGCFPNLYRFLSFMFV